MLLIGPNAVKNGMSPATALIGCRGMALLGPAEGPGPGEVDPIARIFLIIGKLLAVRRAIHPEYRNVQTPESQILQLEHVQMAMLDEGASGRPDEYPEYEVVYQPLADLTEQQVQGMNQMAEQADSAVVRVMGAESARILGLDPNLKLEEKVQAVIDYMGQAGLTVHAQKRGFRDYLMKMFRDASGLPAAFPSSTDPVFPDTWITPEVVVPEGRSRSWIILL